MKIVSNILKNATIATESGNFKVDTNGITDVPDDVANELISTGSFTKIDKAETDEPKAEKSDKKK